MTPSSEVPKDGPGPGVSLIKLAQAQGIALNRQGSVWVGPCPFHEDTANALLIDPSTNHWQCDGACQTGGDVAAWIEKWKALATEEVEDPADASRSNPKPAAAPANEPPQFSSEGDDQGLLGQIVDYYHETLKKTPGALNYLKKRCVGHCGAIDRFKIGFCDRSLGVLLPLKNRKEGAAIRGRLQRLRILKPSGHELFRGSVVVPVMANGRVVQIYGRKITPNLRPGTPQHVVLPAAQASLFNREAVEVSDELIVCPSVLDALTFWCAGYRNVTCAVGGPGFSDQPVQVLETYGTKRVLIAFAATPEGTAAALALADRLEAAGIDVYRVELPEGLDVNAYAMASQSPQEVLGNAIRQATWLGKGRPPAQTSPGPESEPPTGVDGSDGADTGHEAASPVEQEAGEPAEPGPANGEDSLSAPPLPASAVPRQPEALPLEVTDNEVVIQLEQRRYRVRGLEKNLSYDSLKINLLVSQGDGLHVDTFDLYATKPRAHFIHEAAIELGIKEDIIKKDLARLLLQLEILQDRGISRRLGPAARQDPMSDQDRAEAQSLLESPDLVQRLLEDLRQCGLVGETTNKLVAYLAVLSRKLDKPLAVMVQSTSAAGKSALMDAVLNLVPEEERVQYSAITGQSLFYMGNFDLKHKVLAISEEEGASNASYALKLLQSEGHLKIASTGKDPVTGRHTTHEYQVTGPVMIFSTTTAIDVDEELLNRCLVLTVNEDQAQTEAIHRWQRYEETLDGLMAHRARDHILRVHRNAQRLLKPVHVVNPYAEQLTFLSNRTRTRRDHRKYLTLIRSIALLHQFQREVKTTYDRDSEIAYIEVTLDDIALANQIAHEVLGRSLDELPPQSRHLLTLIDQLVDGRCSGSPGSRREVRFTRRDVREHTGWGPTQLTVHLRRLEAMEYLLVHQGGRGRQRVYELLYNREGRDGSAFLMGLADVASLQVSEQTRNLSDTDRPETGAVTGRVRAEKNTGKPSRGNAFSWTLPPVCRGSFTGPVPPVNPTDSSKTTTVRER